MVAGLIKIRDLEFCYPAAARARGFRLRVKELDVAAGERVAFVGPSGCGKTTLAHLIAGIHRAGGGVIEVGGRALHRLGDRARRNFRIREVGFIFQDFALLDYLRVEENILLPYLVNRSLTLDDAARERARGLAQDLGIGALLERRPGQLSGGERQRVAICRALSAQPSLIIADEPTGNLDPQSSSAVTDLICAAAEQRGATLIMVTHDHAQLGKFDRVVDVGVGEVAA